jgi:hypothetical protein
MGGEAMTEHEIADSIEATLRGMRDPVTPYPPSLSEIVETLEMAAAKLRAVPTRAQKIEALTFGREAAAWGVCTIDAMRSYEPDVARSRAIVAHQCGARALRLLGLDDQETP